jgi:hypothetical protein
VTATVSHQIAIDGKVAPQLLVVVPTRNRSDIAINAVRSLLSGAEKSLTIFLSDNSTLPEHTHQLERFVNDCGDQRLLLRRPPRAMSMTHHWDWAMKTALDGPRTTHVVVLTDRMMFKNGSLAALLGVVAQHPEHIVSYAHDRVVDHQEPITVELSPWSGEVIRVSSARLLALSAEGVFPWALPRLLNSVVPRAILEKMHELYGSVVGSISPDYSFCYRSLALVDGIAYWDRAPTVHYALEQSNGHSFSRGVSSAASTDFVSMIPGIIFANAPIPGIRTGGNAILHEYCVARDESRSLKFPAINLHAYAKLIRQDVEQMENREVASEVTAQLESGLMSTGGGDASIRHIVGKDSAIRKMTRRWGIGPRLLRLRRRVNVAFGRSPARPTFMDAGKALECALSSNGERLPVTRLWSQLTP